MAGCWTSRTSFRRAAFSIVDLTLLFGGPCGLHRTLGAVTLPGGLLCCFIAGFVLRALEAQMPVRHRRARQMTIVRMSGIRVGAKRLVKQTPHTQPRHQKSTESQ